MQTERSHTHDWLSLVSMSGLLVSEPVLAEAFPEGPERVAPGDHRKFIREWERFRYAVDMGRADARDRWPRYVLEDLLDLDSQHWLRHPNIPETAVCDLVEYQQTLRPTAVLVGESGEAQLLLTVLPIEQSLDAKESQTGKWRASPFVKLDRLLRETKTQLGLVTNGHEFRLLCAPPGLTTAYISWTAETWSDEKATLGGFCTLLCAERFFGDEDSRLTGLVEESQQKQLVVTDQLGGQVRAALGMLLHALDEADQQAQGQLVGDAEADKLYEMCLIVMMRLVFKLYAEENFLLPHGEVLYDQAYGVTHL